MSARIAAESDAVTDRPRPNDSAEAQPWLSTDDRRGWQTVGHGGRLGTPLERLKLEIDLDAERAQWIIHEARIAGVGPVAYVRSLIDAARSAGR